MLRNKRSTMSCLIRVWHIPILAFLVMMYVHAAQPAAVPSADPVHAINQSGEKKNDKASITIEYITLSQSIFHRFVYCYR